MNVAATVARLLLGLLFIFAGVMPFFLGNPPPLPGVAGEINSAFYQSHWVLAIAFAQGVAGVLLLTNRYVPFALIVLGAFFYNSLAFHALVMPQTLPVPLLCVGVWVVAALPYRRVFTTLFRAKPAQEAEKAYSA